MKKLMAGLVLAAFAALAWALPTLQEVETAVGQGRYAEAETMMREVVAAKPGSARAHYVYAEILAHDGKFAKAAEEAKTARQIDPDLKFVSSPDKFRSFEALLEKQQSAPSSRGTGAVTSGIQPTTAPAVTPAARAPAERSSGIPGWIWGAGIAVLAFVLWRGFSRSRAAAAGAAGVPGAAMAGTAYPGGPGQPGAPYGTPPGGYPPGQYPAGYAPSRGGGLLGTGLAAAGGVAAGMMIDRALHNRDGGNSAAEHDQGSGAQPGYFDAPGAANELENRPIDFGTGGNDWDAGSSDLGGGGGDGGSWD